MVNLEKKWIESVKVLEHTMTTTNKIQTNKMLAPGPKNKKKIFPKQNVLLVLCERVPSQLHSVAILTSAMVMQRDVIRKRQIATTTPAVSIAIVNITNIN